MNGAPKFNTNDPEAVEIRRKVAAIGMELYDVTTLEAVREFEAEAGVKLPDDYVWFITNVGNGGTWHLHYKFPVIPLTTVKEARFVNSEEGEEKYALCVIDEDYDYYFAIILKGGLYGKICDVEDNEACFSPDKHSHNSFKELYTAWLDHAYMGYSYDNLFDCCYRGTVEELFQEYRRSGDADYLRSINFKINSKTATMEFMAKLRAEFICEKDNDKRVLLCDILIKSGYYDPLSLLKKIYRPENYKKIIWHFLFTFKCDKNIRNNKPEYYPMFVEMLKDLNTRPNFDTFYFDSCLEMTVKNPDYNEADIIDVLTTDNPLAVECISRIGWKLEDDIGKYIDLAKEKLKKKE